MNPTNQKEMITELSEILERYGPKLKNCHFIAYMQLKKILDIGQGESLSEAFQEFLWGSLDYLMNCNSEAFSLLFEIAEKYGFEKW